MSLVYPMYPRYLGSTSAYFLETWFNFFFTIYTIISIDKINKLKN